MLKKIIQSIKNHKIQKEIFNVWQDNIAYINSLNKNKVIVTCIVHENSFFLLIYLSKKIFFLNKEINTNFISIAAPAHENIVKNSKVWECIKYSKISGNIMDTSSMMLHISEIIQTNKELFNISYLEEKNIWFDICAFINDIETVGVGIPEYKENENLWVD